MKRYQGDIEYFQQSDTQILAISIDPRPSQKVFAEQLGVQFPFLSDFPKNQVTRLYGVYDPARGVAVRTTFVIDKQGVIRRIDLGQDALDIAGVKQTCGELK
ncbi:MAG: redoxin domain-containing protein [Deltaproteobacteria bacterium]|nr:redoxin domain-containing protein [Deltaproteobacteria bacterium]